MCLWGYHRALRSPCLSFSALWMLWTGCLWPSNSRIKTLIPHVCIWRWGLGRWPGLDEIVGWGSQDRISVLMRRGDMRSLSPSLSLHAPRKAMCGHNQEEPFHQKHDHWSGWHPELALPSLYHHLREILVERNTCCLSHSTYGILLQQPELRQANTFPLQGFLLLATRITLILPSDLHWHFNIVKKKRENLLLNLV